MKVIVVLNLSATNNAGVLADSVLYTTAMTGNAFFAAADVVAQIAATVTATTNLRNAMGAPTSDVKTDNIKIARETLERVMKALAAKVENIANSPTLPDDQRVSVVHSASMQVKGKASSQKQVFAVTQGDVAGSVFLTAAAGAKAHEWQYTADVIDYTGRTAAQTTTTGRTAITGLTSGNKYAFFHKAITSGAVNNWEGPLFLKVN